jgi:hypothetical protein
MLKELPLVALALGLLLATLNVLPRSPDSANDQARGPDLPDLSAFR